MVTIEILQPGCIIEDEPNIKEEIKIEGIDPSCIEPVNMKVGTPFVITELLNLITEIKRIEQLQEKKNDSYYAKGVLVYEDGDLSCKALDLPHHIGLRVVLESVLQKYGTSDNMKIQIS